LFFLAFVFGNWYNSLVEHSLEYRRVFVADFDVSNNDFQCFNVDMSCKIQNPTFLFPKSDVYYNKKEMTLWQQQHSEKQFTSTR